MPNIYAFEYPLENIFRYGLFIPLKKIPVEALVNQNVKHFCTAACKDESWKPLLGTSPLYLMDQEKCQLFSLNSTKSPWLPSTTST